MRILVTIFHTLLVAHYAWGIYVYIFGLNPPKEFAAMRAGFGGPFKYLTFWDMLIQCSYFILAVICDIFSPRKEGRKTKLQRVQDFTFTTIVFSLGAFVSTSFWGLWHVNRELIFPKVLDTFFPNWLNHNIHTTPGIGVLIEMFITRHQYPDQRKGFMTVAGFVGLYLGWVCFIAYYNNFWVYPILAKLTVIGRTAFLAAMCILVGLFYVFGEFLNSKIWGSEDAKLSQKLL